MKEAPKHLFDGDAWVLAEDIPNMDLFFSGIWLNSFVNSFETHTGRAYKKVISKYEGYHQWFYFGDKDSFEVGENIADRIVHEQGYARLVNENIVHMADKLRSFAMTIPQSNLTALSNEELWNIYDEQDRIHTEYYAWAWIPVAVDMFHNSLTNRVKEYLRTKGVSEDVMSETFINLTQPTQKSLIFIEQEELLHIAQMVYERPELAGMVKEQEPSLVLAELPEDIRTALSSHCEKYFYTKHIWVEGEYTLVDYVGQIKEMLTHHHEAPSVIIAKQNEELEKVKHKKAQIISELGIDGLWKDVFYGFGDFMVTKIYRRYAQLLAVHHMNPVLKEIARRAYVTEKQVRFMRPVEIKVMLLEKKYDEAELLSRTSLCLYYAEKDVERLYIGDEAKEILKTVEKEIDTNISVLKGESACVGYAKGVVKIVIRAEDMAKMNKGDILVSIATDPDIVPAMKKAAAIVTEQGGVTSHAAIVSRELGIPCVIATKIATKVLKDGDVVEVDANKGIVTKIS